MDQRHLTTLSQQLTAFLGSHLPARSARWWQTHVLDQLTFQQQRHAEAGGLTRLDQLDLAALLRIADRNWSELAQAAALPAGARNWLKEAQTIRNRWAHVPADGIPDDDRLRDLDSIERLMQALGADPASIRDIRAERTALLVQLAARVAPTHPTPARAAHAPEPPPQGAFALGQLVRLKARPTVTGAVTARIAAEPEDRYQVFHDGGVNSYFASQIEPAALPEAHPGIAPSELHAALTALQLRHPSMANLYSLFAARVNFVPYQFRPVLKLIQSDRPRLLIADEVGVGKTIEAGLILKELQARGDLRSVLVVCPKPLVAERKWLNELKRFDEQFTHLDGPALRYCIDETHLDGLWPQQYARAILPYSLLGEDLLMGQQRGRRHQRGLLELDPPPAFDLIIVDEAHHLRNTDTWAYRTLRLLCDHAEAVLLLSATPVQLGSNDLFTLLNLLRPDLLPDPAAFTQMAEPNPHLHAAAETVRAARPGWRAAARDALTAALATPWGRGVLATNPSLQPAHDALNASAGDLDDAPDQPTERLALLRQIEDLYTFAPLINRTRRRDIGSFTTRKPETLEVPFTPEQGALHADLLDLIARILAQRHGDLNLRFLMSTIRRQAASCLFGLAPLLRAILGRHLSELERSELDDGDGPDDPAAALAGFRADVDALIRRADALTGPDPKRDALCQVIRDKQRLDNNKLLLFSSFRHTLAYLIDHLGREPVRVGLIHGAIPDEERRDLRHRFSLPRAEPDAIDLLLSSEVGCEGLDFQFCDALINYDLPWNPMRIEQRIGRIDRYGQRSETVAIYNLITPGTVDAEIYDRCLLRIGVFRQALGGSEEILGQITRELHDIAENLSLSDAERQRRLQQLADNEIRAVQEQARLEDEQAKLFGLQLPQRDADLVSQASSFWLAPARLANLVARYLETLGAKPPATLGQKPVSTLQLGQDIRTRLLADAQTLDQTGAAAQTWQRWLKGNEPYLALTFDAATAADRADLAFITPTHPLARQAARASAPGAPLRANLRFTSADLPAGRYPYAIYQWRKLGLKEDFTFQPICTEPALTARILALLEAAEPGDPDQTLTAEEEQALDRLHYRLWADARAAHCEHVVELAQARLSSLTTTHAARLNLLQDQRAATTEPRIRRMREAQISAAVRDFEQRAEGLRVAGERGDIIADQVVSGVVTIERG
jgi:ATP-dependent helicase HepA